jgi:hypothetical protein
MKFGTLLILPILLFFYPGQALELTQYAGRCYNCLGNNTDTSISAYYCRGLDKCFTSAKDLSQNCTVNATDPLECFHNMSCSLPDQAFRERSGDFIILREATNATFRTTRYAVGPNQRCQFVIVNSIAEEYFNATVVVE